MEYMYNVINFDTASYEPCHEKICLRGLRPGHRHKTGCTATEASWRLDFGIKERTFVTLNRICTISKIKPLIVWCARFIRGRKLFTGSGSSFPPYQYV